MTFQTAQTLGPPSLGGLTANNAGQIVTSVIADSGAMAHAAQAVALQAIAALGNFHLNLAPLAPPAVPDPQVNPSVLGTVPSDPGAATNFPYAPGEPALASLALFDPDTPPAYDVAPPFLVDIPVPDPFAALVPPAPVLGEVAMPVAPGFVLPEVPTLIALNLPDAPTLDLPDFTDVLGAAPGAPTASFSWSEVTYDTALLGTLNSRLAELVGGAASGLSPAVEDAIWQRGREREALLAQDAVGEATRMFAGRGFSIPGGTLARIVQQALQDANGRASALSRDVMIKQAELEQSNFQFAFNTAMQLESRLIEHFNAVQNRALDAAKFTFQALIQIFQARVQLYQADVAAFTAKADVFKTRLQAALARLDIYKAELEGQQLIGALNTQLVQRYTAQLEGVKTTAELFRTQVDAAKAQLEAQQQRVSVYVAQLQGYDSQVKSKATEYEGYATRVRAELSKVQMFSEQVGAYKSRTEAYGALVNARLGAQSMNFKQLQEFPLEVYRQRVAAYQAGVSAEAERLRAEVALFEGRVRAFAATETAKATQVEAQVEVARLHTQVFTSGAQLQLQAGEANLRLAVSAAETAQGSLRAAAQVSGQLAAAALAARNVHAAISQTDSDSSSRSASISNTNASSNSGSSSESDSTTHQE